MTALTVPGDGHIPYPPEPHDLDKRYAFLGLVFHDTEIPAKSRIQETWMRQPQEQFMNP